MCMILVIFKTQTSRFYFVWNKPPNPCLKYTKYLHMYISMNDIKNYLNNLKCPDKITDKGLVIESPPSSDNVKAVYC